MSCSRFSCVTSRFDKQSYHGYDPRISRSIDNAMLLYNIYILLLKSVENVDRNDIRYYAESSNHFPPPSARFLFSFVQVLFFGPFECSPNAKGKPFYEFSYGTKLFYFIFGIPSTFFPLPLISRVLSRRFCLL